MNSSGSQPDDAPAAHQAQIPGQAGLTMNTIFRNTSALESPLPSEMPRSQVPRKQEVMKSIMAEELKGATYKVDLTGEDAIFHANPDTVQAVLRRLQSHHHLTASSLTTAGQSSSAKPRLPKRGFKIEKSSYKPFVHLLNKIVDASNECMPGSRLGRLHFYDFGREVKEMYGSFKGLKPDGIGTIGEPLTQEEVVSWNDIEVILESKNSVKDMVKQAATYARCSLLNNSRRCFALVICLQFTSLDVYILVFHRSGLSASSPLGLKNKLGFDGLVKHMVGLLAIQEEAAYGLDVTRSQDIFLINNRYYRHVRSLYLRDSLRGRATAVYSLNGMYSCVDPK